MILDDSGMQYRASFFFRSISDRSNRISIPRRPADGSNNDLHNDITVRPWSRILNIFSEIQHFWFAVRQIPSVNHDSTWCWSFLIQNSTVRVSPRGLFIREPAHEVWIRLIVIRLRSIEIWLISDNSKLLIAWIRILSRHRSQNWLPARHFSCARCDRRNGWSGSRLRQSSFRQRDDSNKVW